MWYVYIVRCKDNSLYTGITTDLKRRVSEHNFSDKSSKYTRAHRPVKLVYKKRFETKSEASIEEARIKKLSKKEKEELVFEL